MTKNEDHIHTNTCVDALKPWVAPQIISSNARDTASNALPTYIESTVPTDRPS